MRRACSAVRALLAGLSAAAALPALADRPWMTEEAMRAAFIGKTLDGHYANDQDWTETYEANGRLRYTEGARTSGGYWYFRGRVFCTFYDPGQGFSGGCFTALQTSSNCYEFYLAGLSERDTETEPPAGTSKRWVARAARRGEPSTCEARPTV